MTVGTVILLRARGETATNVVVVNVTTVNGGRTVNEVGSLPVAASGNGLWGIRMDADMLKVMVLATATAESESVSICSLSIYFFLSPALSFFGPRSFTSPVSHQFLFSPWSTEAIGS